MIGHFEVVLLSHDHQGPDDFGMMGGEYLAATSLVLSTASAQAHLGGSVRALANWWTRRATSSRRRNASHHRFARPVRPERLRASGRRG